ncbi:MAG: cysteine desulfurase NifS [Clostridiales bacterium]|nr:cysteine desulfurase NifS [Clostridiales bacterium]
MDRIIYLDHAATTYTKPEVLKEMLPYFTEIYGNPSSVHSYGRETRKALDLARERTAKALNADPAEIIFTSGGTEADNLAIIGTATANKKKGNHIITSSIEHPAALHSCQYLEKNGFQVTYLPVDEYGLIDPQDVKEAIKENTILISIMTANNEIGTIQPVREIGAIAKEKGVLFHTDAVQAVGSIPNDVRDMNIDLLTLSAHKSHGPKGVGALYARKGVRLNHISHGGAQERNRRAGTENLPAIVGLGKAIELATQDIEARNEKLRALRDRLISGILSSVEYTRLNGHPTKRLAGNSNFSFEFIEGEALLLSLDMKGIAASSGSACTSGTLDPSHVLLAIGLPHEIAHGSLRLTLGDENTEEEIDYVLEVLPQIVQRLREMSPLFNQDKGGKIYV